MRRTFKRELASGLLVFWALMTIRLFWWAEAGMVDALGAAYGAMTLAVFGFAAGAFGLDCYAKQIKPHAPMDDPRGMDLSR